MKLLAWNLSYKIWKSVFTKRKLSFLVVKTVKCKRGIIKESNLRTLLLKIF